MLRAVLPMLGLLGTGTISACATGQTASMPAPDAARAAAPLPRADGLHAWDTTRLLLTGADPARTCRTATTPGFRARHHHASASTCRAALRELHRTHAAATFVSARGVRRHEARIEAVWTTQAARRDVTVTLRWDGRTQAWRVTDLTVRAHVGEIQAA